MDHPGIYVITHTESGKCYIGSSINVRKRFASHRLSLRRAKHHCIYLQGAWTKYGEDAFTFGVLEECAMDKAILLEREQYYLDTLNPEYNMLRIAGSRLGSLHTPEARAKIAAGNKGKLLGRAKTPEHVEQMRQRIIRQETRDKQSAAKLGTTRSEETRARMSAAHTGRAKDPESIRKAWEQKSQDRFERAEAIRAELATRTLVKNDTRPALRKLTDEQIIEIRNSKVPASTLCKQLNCSATTINKIRRGLIYRDVT